MIEAVLRQRATAVEQLLVKLYEFFTHRSLPPYNNNNASNKKGESAKINITGRTASTCIVDVSDDGIAVNKGVDDFNVDDTIGNNDRNGKTDHNKLKAKQ